MRGLQVEAVRLFASLSPPVPARRRFSPSTICFGVQLLVFKRFQISTLTVIVLVGLRLVVGWHFYKEGAKKVQDPAFRTAQTTGFLRQAVGPLAPLYHNGIPDYEGRLRLYRDPDPNKDFTLGTWGGYVDEAADHYGFDDKQAQQAEKILLAHALQLNTWFAENGPDIEEYFKELERLERMKAGANASVPYQRERITKKDNELWGKRNGWIRQIEAIETRLVNSIYNLATPEQREAGLLPIYDPGFMWKDDIIAYTLLIVGVLILLGLFVRPAGIVAALFLLSVIAAQPPWVAGAAPTYNQFIELFAVLVLVATGAGRFAGLDFFLTALCAKYLPSKRKPSTEAK